MVQLLLHNTIEDYYKEYHQQGIRIREGVFWTQKQRQSHSMHYVVPYQASFAPQIPEFFIKRYSQKGDVVLDPFCGRGTTILEANLHGRIGVGTDISPLAIAIAKAKLNKVTCEEVEKFLESLDLSKENLEGYEVFRHIYHPKTYSQLMNLREKLGDDPVSNLVRAIVLGRLHGHSDAFFSVWTFNVISLSPEAIKKQSERHGAKPEFRDIVPRILKKARTILRDSIPEVPGSAVFTGETTNLPLPSDAIDLVVTSPPFLATINYIDDNWLRFWFIDFDREKLRENLVQTSDVREYTEFVRTSMREMHRVLKKGKYCVVEAGDVTHKSKKINLDTIIVGLAPETGFKVEEILINHISAPKISKAFGKRGKETGTRTNRCVVMRKI